MFRRNKTYSIENETLRIEYEDFILFFPKGDDNDFQSEKIPEEVRI